MKILERAIRLGLESDSINTVYTYTQNESVEMVANGTNAETEMVRYRASVESIISRSSSQGNDGLSYNDRSFSEEEENNLMYPETAQETPANAGESEETSNEFLRYLNPSAAKSDKVDNTKIRQHAGK